MSRMMRALMECMYPKEVKGSELVQAILQWEMKWNQVMKDQLAGTNIPELWKMAALMKMCPKEIKHNIELGWDKIDEKYSVMREKVVMVGHKRSGERGRSCAHGRGHRGRRRMRRIRGRGMSRERVGGCGPPHDQVRLLSGHGHMARACPAKSKSKGGVKGGGKGVTKGGTKGGGKGGPQGGSGKGDGKGYGMGQGVVKGAGNDLVTRTSCGKIGHKSPEQRLRGWRRGAASGCGRGDHGGGALDRG